MVEDDIDDTPRLTPKRSAQRERDAFQPVCIQFLRRVLIQPYFLSATISENQLTQNARARAKARGFRAGLPDLYIAQMKQSIWLELKVGKNKPSDAQLDVKAELVKAGIACAVCWSIADVLHALQQEMFALLPNARNLAAEFEERVAAAVRRVELRAAKPHAPQRQERPSASRIKRAHAIGLWKPPGSL